MKNFKFKNIYKFANIISNSVNSGIQMFNYNEDLFIEYASKTSKETLLHMYIYTTLLNYYSRNFRKNNIVLENGEENWFNNLFKVYEVSIPPFDEDKQTAFEWFNNNIENFQELFERITPEVFHILFANRNFLLVFNKLMSRLVKETVFPNDVAQNGKIKRIKIPKWATNAVFHRDKGHCVFCAKDLSGIISILNIINYDHIVALVNFGTNDPCNIQLTCDECNTNKQTESSTTNMYQPWW